MQSLGRLPVTKISQKQSRLPATRERKVVQDQEKEGGQKTETGNEAEDHDPDQKSDHLEGPHVDPKKETGDLDPARETAVLESEIGDPDLGTGIGVTETVTESVVELHLGAEPRAPDEGHHLPGEVGTLHREDRGHRRHGDEGRTREAEDHLRHHRGRKDR